MAGSGISLNKTMESSEWNKLPGDVEILVLLRLSPLDLSSLSLTCNYFNSLLSDPSFAIHYDRHRLRHPALFLTSLWPEKPMKKSVSKSAFWKEGSRYILFPWHNPSFEYLHGYRRWSCTYGDGFMCLEITRSGHTSREEVKKLLVLNPLFPHDWTTLPLPTDSVHREFYTGITFDRKHGVCKLVLWCRVKAFASQIITFVYNFKQGAWKRVPGSIEICMVAIINCGPQLVNDRFLCWLCSDWTSAANTVLVFDVEEETWRAQIPLGDKLFVCIAEHKKQLCVISERYNEEEEEKNLELCKFDIEESVWAPVEYFPLPPIDIWESKYPFWGGRGFIWVEEWDWDTKCIWIYDLSHHFWQRLGQIPSGKFSLEGSLFRLSTNIK